MRKLFPTIHYIILSGMIMFLYSCTPESCFEETEAFLKVSFYNNDTKNKLAPDSLTIYGLDLDTLKIYDNAKKVEPALLPLNDATISCSFIIKINEMTDTIELIYNSYPHLISKECGYTYYHNLDTIKHTTNAIDYIFINKSNITTVNEENIRIFY